MKRKYSRPILLKQETGYMNKFNTSGVINDYLAHIDGVAIETLVEKFGSPLFVFSEKRIRENYHEVKNAFMTRYPKFVFSWSYKTNYLGSICNIFHQEGSIAEVVSGFEYDKAKALGIKDEDIIFNGPYKEEKDIERAFKEGAILNLDNFDEITVAEKISNKLKRKIKVGIRLNMDVGIYPIWYKFGFNLENGQAYQAIKRIEECKYLTVNGLHTHIGTFVLDPMAYSKATEKIIDFMYEMENKESIHFDYIDLGGGLPSNNRLKGIYLPPDISTPTIDEYANAITGVLQRKLDPNKEIKIYLENGRALIDDAGHLITTIVNRKNHPDGTKSYMIDAGVNLMYTATWYDYKIRPTQPHLTSIKEYYKLYGPLCMNIDVVAQSISLPDLPVDSQLIISPMGAYNVTQWMQFITYRPACVMIMADGTVEIIRKREKLKDIMGCEEIPEKLKKIY